MTIRINLDIMMAKRKMRLKTLAKEVGITEANLSVLKNGKARAVRLSTLDKLCEVLECQPGDILEFEPNDHQDSVAEE
ncbi:helix-turn-helix transcriptional regulator [Vibrio atlanticus]|nr:helix-turn-helix transcriptional regulator [Vibrio atlanticus]